MRVGASPADSPYPMAKLAADLLIGTHWLDVRKQQDAGRSFGPAATDKPIHDISTSFIRNTPAVTFFPADDREPDGAIREHINR